MSRKAISVVKTVFLNCTDDEHSQHEHINATCSSFISKNNQKVYKCFKNVFEIMLRN